MNFISVSLQLFLLQDGNLRSSTSLSLLLLFYSSDMMETDSLSTRGTNICCNGSELLADKKRRNKWFNVWGIIPKPILPTSTTHNTGDSMYEMSKHFSQYLGRSIQSAQSPKLVCYLLLSLALKIHPGRVSGTGWWAQSNYENRFPGRSLV